MIHTYKMELKESLVTHYFLKGHSQLEILHFLKLWHGVSLSRRHLCRILKKLELRRKNIMASPNYDICLAVVEELNGSGSCLGYRSLWRRLQKTYGLTVKRETVRHILKIADPFGVEARSKRRLQRRQYIVPGPNFLWHVDGYDKLKPFGFAIHGAIDGYSRKIIWLKVASSNNNPKIIANYYLNAIKQLQLVPTLIRADKGTENSLLGPLQIYLRLKHDDKLSGKKSYIEGKSTSNQKIECYWSQMRRQGANWWISYFKDLRDSCIFNDGDPLHIECLRFCFGHLIQYDLDIISTEWNEHKIRKQKNIELQSGKPNCLFYLPEMYGTKDYAKDIDTEVVSTCQELYATEPSMCSPLFKNLLQLIACNSTLPKTIEEARQLFRTLTEIFENY